MGVAATENLAEPCVRTGMTTNVAVDVGNENVEESDPPMAACRAR